MSAIVAYIKVLEKLFNWKSINHLTHLLHNVRSKAIKNVYYYTWNGLEAGMRDEKKNISLLIKTNQNSFQNETCRYLIEREIMKGGQMC